VGTILFLGSDRDDRAGRVADDRIWRGRRDRQRGRDGCDLVRRHDRGGRRLICAGDRGGRGRDLRGLARLCQELRCLMIGVEPGERLPLRDLPVTIMRIGGSQHLSSGNQTRYFGGLGAT
jgi:hypothetical protein